MSQKLILPINATRITASYKNTAYKTQFGFAHFGVDSADLNRSNYIVWSLGSGEVLDCGTDNCFGNYVAIKYPDAYNHTQKRSADVIARMFHFDKLNIHIGQIITKDTLIGYYGDTGTYANGKHLHLEIDEDTKYTHYTPTLSGDSSCFKGTRSGATDATMSNPLEWLHCKTSAKDYQSYTTNGDKYINSSDYSIPEIQ